MLGLSGIHTTELTITRPGRTGRDREHLEDSVLK